MQYLCETNLPGSSVDKLKDLYQTNPFPKLKKDSSDIKFKRIATK